MEVKQKYLMIPSEKIALVLFNKTNIIFQRKIFLAFWVSVLVKKIIWRIITFIITTVINLLNIVYYLKIY